MPTLLFIDDDHELTDLNKRYFTKLGYTVKITDSGIASFNLIKKYKPDCIILDIMMPEINGFEVCEKIRQFSPSPIIFLSGRITEDDKIKGLLIGGNDYITKPYSLKELSARIQVQLRQNTTLVNNTKIIHPPFLIDLVVHKAYCNNIEIHLSNREYELLNLLISNPNQIVTFESISETIWNYYSEAERKTIMVIASRLRKKIYECAGIDNIIETIRSEGYKFISK